MQQINSPTLCPGLTVKRIQPSQLPVTFNTWHWLHIQRAWRGHSTLKNVTAPLRLVLHGCTSSLGILDLALRYVGHTGILDFAFVQLILPPQQQLEQTGQFRSGVRFQDSCIQLTGHLYIIVNYFSLFRFKKKKVLLFFFFWSHFNDNIHLQTSDPKWSKCYEMKRFILCLNLISSLQVTNQLPAKNNVINYLKNHKLNSCLRLFCVIKKDVLHFLRFKGDVPCFWKSTSPLSRPSNCLPCTHTCTHTHTHTNDFFFKRAIPLNSFWIHVKSLSSANCSTLSYNQHHFHTYVSWPSLYLLPLWYMQEFTKGRVLRVLKSQ